MAEPVIVAYTSYRPRIGRGARFGDGAALIGRANLGDDATLGRLVTLRADGEHIEVGRGCTFLDRATVHISDGLLPSVVGERATVGRYALVHACTLGDDCVLADGAVVMDGAKVGDGAVIAAGALVPPGKQLDGATLHAGNPARPVRAVGAEERAAFRDAVLAGASDDELLRCALPPLDMAPFRPPGAGAGPLHALAGAEPAIDAAAYVAPTALAAGRVSVAAGGSIWFAVACRAEGAEIRIGERSNVQDNSILVARDGGDIVIGKDVTVGHNVRMGACTIGDECLIGMGCEIGDGTVVEDGGAIGARALVEPGTVVEAGWIWAGRPARAFRPLKPEEIAFFRRGTEVYVGYTATYLKGAG
jgi:carbonic anhydrase/acetyltransferase-like protein (isoleucine patch superfamily)